MMFRRRRFLSQEHDRSCETGARGLAMQVPSFTALPLVEGGRWRLLVVGRFGRLAQPWKRGT
jgi:hypothetical protein